MNNKNKIITVILCIFVFILSTVSVFADSSWIWISETRPYDLFPIVIILTLIVEIIAINYWAEVHMLLKTCIVVTLANLASFLIPYWITVYIDGVHQYPDTLNDYHSIVIGPYLILTFMLEVPIIMLLLKKNADKKKLFIVTLVANVLTTLMVYAIEKIFCEGYYV